MKPAFLTALALTCLFGCAMLVSWKSIPPPGGCDQCHQQAIGHDWTFGLRPVALHDETGQHPWQRPGSMDLPEASPAGSREIATQRCFRCHKSPDRDHLERQGRYHHN